VRKTQEIDIFINDVLVENNKNSTLHVDRLLKATQEKVLQILGPLTRLWEITDREKIYVDDEVPEEVEQFQKSSSKTVQFNGTVSLVYESIPKQD